MPVGASSDAPVWCAVADSDTSSSAERGRLAGLLAAEAQRADRVLLVTCQRVELYGVGARERPVAGMRLLAGEAAVRRVFRIAAGLESQITGEDEVLGQVRAASASAPPAARDPRLRRLFESAVAAGRRCRAGRGPTGNSLAALAARTLLEMSNGSDRPFMVAGAGYMGAALARSIRRRAPSLTVASRSLERARALAAKVGAAAITLGDAATVAPSAGGLAVALGGAWPARFAAGSLPPTVDLSSPPALPREACRNYRGIDQFLAGGRADGGDYRVRAAAVVDAAVASFFDSMASRAVAV